MVSPWSLSDRNSVQVPWTLLGILVHLHNAEVLMFSIHPLISKSTGISTPRLLFTTVLGDGLSLRSEWQWVSSSFQNFSEYSGLSNLCCSLDDLCLSFYFNSSTPAYQGFGNRFERIFYHWYHCYFHVPELYFFFFWLGLSICLSFFFSFSLVFNLLSTRTVKSSIRFALYFFFFVFFKLSRGQVI